MSRNKKRIASRFLLTLLIFVACASYATAQGIVSPFNGLSLDLDEKEDEYSFLLGGHLYGAHGYSVYPSSSLLANIDSLNATNAKFFVSLGDVFRSADTIHIPNYQEAFTSKLKMPVFNAVGNHDVTDRELYETRFGKTYYRFVYGTELFVLLDSELDRGSILGPQLDFFVTTIREATKNPEIQNVFIFSHKLIWDVDNPPYQVVFEHANEPYPTNNFKREIEPLLIELSRHATVHWVSGDVGTHWSLPLFYRNDPDYDITYIAVGIGDTEKDALLEIRVNPDTSVTVIPIPLASQDLSDIKAYGLGYWQDHFAINEPVFDIHWYWGKLNQIVRHSYFWTGVLASISVSVLALLLYRKYARQ